MWDEAYAHLVNEERNAEREAQETKQYDHDEHEMTTFERAQYTAENFREDEEQDISERDDKIGAI